MSGSILGKVALVLSQIILARNLGPQQYGLFILGWTILRVNGIISLFGIDKASIFMVGEDNDKLKTNRILTISLFSSLIISFTTCFSIYLMRENISYFFSSNKLLDILPLFSVITFFYILNQILASFTRIRNKMHFSVLVKDFLQPVIFIVLLIFIYHYFSINIKNVLLSLLSTFIISFIFGIFFVLKSFPDFRISIFSRSQLINFLKYSFATFFAGVFSNMMLWVDRIMIGYFCDDNLVGIYQSASQSTMIFTMIISSFGLATSPLISKLFHKQKYGKIKEIFYATIRWSAYLCFPLIIVIVTLPTNFITYVYGQDYFAATGPLVFLTFSKFIHIYCGTVGILLVMTNNQSILMKITIIFFIVNIFLNYYLIPIYSIVGASVSTCISISLLFISGRLISKYRLNLSVVNIDMLKILVIFFVTLFIANITKYSFSNSIITFLLFLFLNYCVFYAFLFLTGVYKSDYRFFYGNK